MRAKSPAYFNLQGRVKFPIGGKVREPSNRQDLVKFQNRQYSLDEEESKTAKNTAQAVIFCVFLQALSREISRLHCFAGGVCKFFTKNDRLYCNNPFITPSIYQNVYDRCSIYGLCHHPCRKSTGLDKP